MSEEKARTMALEFCMQGVGRYLECLHGVVNTLKNHLPAEFVLQVRLEFADYAYKMYKAGLPFKYIKNFEQGDAWIESLEKV